MTALLCDCLWLNVSNDLTQRGGGCQMYKICIQVYKRCWRVKKRSEERHSAQMANCCVGMLLFLGRGFDNPPSPLFKAYWHFKRWQRVVFCSTAAQPPDLVITFQRTSFPLKHMARIFRFIHTYSRFREALFLGIKNPCGWKAERERKGFAFIQPASGFHVVWQRCSHRTWSDF